MSDAEPRADDARVYFNGAIIPAPEARLPIDDRGVLYGLGFFETFRTSGGYPHHWKYNRRRLEQACARADIAIPKEFLATDELRLHETVRQLLRESGREDAVFRYTITAGADPRVRAGGDSAGPAEFLTARPMPPPAPVEGVRLRTLKLARDAGEWLPRPKSLNYANAYLGAQELQRRNAGASDEGLFLDADGHVVETARQNLAWLEGERLFYPDPDLGAVAGTCLAWVLESMSAMPRRSRVTDLLGADAVIVLNSVRGITPVCEVWDENDATQLRAFDSAAHPIVSRLRERWRDALRRTAAGE